MRGNVRNEMRVYRERDDILADILLLFVVVVLLRDFQMSLLGSWVCFTLIDAALIRKTGRVSGFLHLCRRIRKGYEKDRWYDVMIGFSGSI